MANAGTELRALWVIGHRVTPIPVGDRVAALEVVTPAGIPGPPPHHHEDASEFFFVTVGRLGVMMDGEWTSIGPGGYAEVPRGVIHTFRNETDEDLRSSRASTRRASRASSRSSGSTPPSRAPSRRRSATSRSGASLRAATGSG